MLIQLDSIITQKKIYVRESRELTKKPIILRLIYAKPEPK